MIADWRADEDNTFRLTLEINKSKIEIENDRLSMLDYDDVFKAFLSAVTALGLCGRDYLLERSKTLINNEINDFKRIGLYNE